jgi:hypothetical protein
MPYQDTTQTDRIVQAVNRALNPPAIYRTVSWASTDASLPIQEMAGFLTAENHNDFELRLMPQVYRRAAAYLEGAGQRIALSRPEITPDADGGIEIDWEKGNRRLTLSCRKDVKEDFISWRKGNDPYEGGEASQALLNKKLDWLIGSFS